MIITRPRGLAATTAYSTQQIQNLITQTANQYGVPPSIALAVAQKESNFNQSAIGTKGDTGIFQLMPATAAELRVNSYDTQGNITGGVTYLSQLFAQYGDWGTALAAYNGGPGNMARGTTPASSYAYAASVLSTAGMPQTTSGAPAVMPGGGLVSPSDEVTAIYESDQPEVTLAGVGGGTLALILGGGAILILMMGRRRRSAS